MSETNKKKLLYQQLKEHILEDYKNQPYHTPLPGERALCDIYHVSRPTVRKALELLEEDGCITRFPGKGCFLYRRKQNRKREKSCFLCDCAV